MTLFSDMISLSLLFIAFFTSHRSPLSERLEQAKQIFNEPPIV